MELNRTIAPEVKEVKNFTIPKVYQEQFGFSNCTRLVDNSLKVVRVDWVFEAGLFFQTKPLLASSMSNMLNKGSKNFDYQSIAQKIDSVGAYFDTSNSFDVTSISLYSLSTKLNELLPLVEEMLNECIIPEEELHLDLRNRKQNFTISSKKVGTVAQRKFMAAMFPKGHSYNSIVDKDSFDCIAQKDVMNYYEQRIKQRAPNVFVAGNLLDTSLSKLKTSLEIKKEYEISQEFNSIAPEFGNYSEDWDDAMQTAIKIGGLSPSRGNVDYPAFYVLVTILGGYFGSRLMKNLREEKGLTYGIGSGITNLKFQSFWSLSTEVKKEGKEVALQEIWNEIELLRKGVVSDEEIETVLSYLKGQIMRGFDGVFESIDRCINIFSAGNNLEYYLAFVDKLQNVNAEEVKEMANKYFSKEKCIEVTVG